MKLALAILATALSANAATYYVATNGNDSADGSLATPWLTINHAGSVVGPGDTVNVGPGEFSEFVYTPVDGTAGNPIVFQGTRGGSGEWLTTINPSTLLTNWQAAPEVGPGVYKTNGLPWMIAELTAGSSNQRLPRIYSTGSITANIDYVYYGSGFTTATQLLSQPDPTTVQDAGTYHPSFNMWDTLGAAYAAEGTDAYIRFRNGGNPNTNNVRGAPNNGIIGQVQQPAVIVYGNSYLTFRNFKVLGAYGGFQIRGAATHHVVIESNYISGCSSPIEIWIGPSTNTIRGNEIFANYIGWTNNGAYTTTASLTLATYRHNVYNIGKYLAGQGSSTSVGINVYNAGNDNVIVNNYVHGGYGEGIVAQSLQETDTENMVIATNVISNHSSAGLVLGPSQKNQRVFDNLLSDNNGNIRIQPMDYTPTETNRLVYVYRNRLYQPTAEGEHIYVFWMNPVGPTITYVNYWFYQNSFSGGSDWFLPNGYVVARGGCPGFRFYNNIVSSVGTFSAACNGVYTGWCDAAMVGACDYNLIPVSIGQAWIGSHNIQTNTPTWVNAAGMSFVLPANSKAINSGLDLPTVYPALPQDGTVKVGGAWDMGVLEWSSPVAITRLRVTHMKGKP